MGFNDHFLLDFSAFNVVDSDVAEPVTAGKLFAIRWHFDAADCISHFSEPVVIASEDSTFKKNAIFPTI